MKLATLNNGTRDGRLIVVNHSLTEYVSAPADLPTMQSSLDDWVNSSNMLLQLFNDLEAGKLQSNKLKIDTIQGKLTRRKISNIFGKKFTNLAYEDILRSYPSVNWSLENGGKEEDFFGLV